MLALSGSEMLMSPGAGAVQEIKSRPACAWPVALVSCDSEETGAILRYSCMRFALRSHFL